MVGEPFGDNKHENLFGVAVETSTTMLWIIRVLTVTLVLKELNQVSRGEHDELQLTTKSAHCDLCNGLYVKLTICDNVIVSICEKATLIL